MSFILKASSLLIVLVLPACITVPSSPSVLVLPGTGKNFDQFRVDDLDCRQYAYMQVGGATTGAVSDESVVRSAAFGTILGAIAGAAIDGSHGAGVGAATGLALGGISGTGAGQASAYELQRRYDFAYQQCMYAKGNRVPAPYGFENLPTQNQTYSYSAPPPPTGTPPSPPPR